MLNEHIVRTIEQEKDKFRKEISNVIANFNEATNKLLKKFKDEIEKAKKKDHRSHE